MKVNEFCEIFARKATQWAGSTTATVVAFLVIIVWLLGGFLFFGFDTDYQMYINTGTTIVTYVLVFLIQRSQNKDSFVLQMKLNELIAAHLGASNRLISIEDLTEDEIAKLHRRYQRLSHLSKDDDSRTLSHTVEEIDDD